MIQTRTQLFASSRRLDSSVAQTSLLITTFPLCSQQSAPRSSATEYAKYMHRSSTRRTNPSRNQTKKSRGSFTFIHPAAKEHSDFRLRHSKPYVNLRLSTARRRHQLRVNSPQGTVAQPLRKLRRHNRRPRPPSISICTSIYPRTNQQEIIKQSLRTLLGTYIVTRT